ncbi:hypothetical protein [Cohnella kolymensis]|uniref:hypothetical protein n=1 Tax=Cohnella kolymensis TaxID=1590652 RepID=UPI00126993B4|nr:hypothetical protein [Cohnella kolymensis]
MNLNYVFPLKNKIALSKQSFAQITDINMDILEEHNILTYTIQIYNGERTPINLIDYWVSVRSKSTGATYSSVISTADKTKSKISSKTSQTIRFFSKLDKNVKLSDIKFELVKWDFSSVGYMRKLGELSVTKAFNPAVKTNMYKTVFLSDTPIKLNISDFSSAKMSSEDLFSISLQLQSLGKRTLTSPKLKFYLKSNTGLTYPLSADLSQDVSLLPSQKRVISLGTSVPDVSGITSWMLQINQEDETAKVELGIATFQLPTSTSSLNTIPVNQEKIISVNNKKVGARVKFATALDNDSQGVSVIVSLINRDTSAIPLPKYDFKLVTNGYTFPLSSQDKDSSISLNPMQEKTFSLKTTVPATIGTQDAQLIMLQQQDASAGSDTATNAVGFPVGIFKLGNLVENNPGKSMFMDTASGTYQVTMDSIQRLPWADTDVLAIHFKLKNPNYTRSVPVPKLQGYITIDGITAADTDTKYIQPDSVYLMAPNTEIDGYLVTKIPYYSEYSVLQAGLQEKVGESITEVAQFMQGHHQIEFPAVSLNAEFKSSTKGKQAMFRVRSTKSYSGSGTTIFYAEMELNNLEARNTNLPQIVGFFTTGNGDYYKASVSQQDIPTTARGKSLVSLWLNCQITSIPQSLSC